MSTNRISSGKVDQVTTDCLYRLATGEWKPGHKLPALREAARIWGVNGLTCLRAYRRLIAQGLVVSRMRGGYFVAESSSVVRLTGHQAEVQSLFRRFAALVRERSGLTIIGAARAVARLAETRANERPEVVFVECTRFQADGHAREIATQLRIPCLAMTVQEIAGQRDRLAPEVRFVLTTYFHSTELEKLAAPGLTVLPVSIEFDPDFVSSFHHKGIQEVIILGLKGAMAKSISNDLSRAVKRNDLRYSSRQVHVGDLENVLEQLLNSKNAKGRIIIVSTTLWSEATDHWRAHPQVRPYAYRIVLDDLQKLADQFGVPWMERN